MNQLFEDDSIRPRSPTGETRIRGKSCAGMVDFPGTGPPGKTCFDCVHCLSIPRNVRNVLKCRLAYQKWTHGEGIDIKRYFPACSKFQAKGVGDGDSENRS